MKFKKQRSNKMKELKKAIDRLFDAMVDEEKDEIKATLHELKDDLGKPCTLYEPLNGYENGFELGDLKTRVEDELYNISVYEFNRKPIENLDDTRYILSGNLASLIINQAESILGCEEASDFVEDEIDKMGIEPDGVYVIDLRDLIDRYGYFLPKYKNDYVITEYSKDKLESLLDTLADDEELFDMIVKDNTDIKLINLNTGDVEWTEFSKDFIKELARILEDETNLEYALNELAERVDK